MEITADVKLEAFNDALYRLARATGKEFGVVVKANARLLAINLAIMTQPWSGKEGNFKSGSKGALTYNGVEDRKMGEAAVRRDIGRVYRTIDQIYHQIEVQTSKQSGGGSKAARAFYGAAINGNFERAHRILRSFRIFDRGAQLGKFDAGDAHQGKRRARGRVYSRRAELVVTNPKALVTYVKKIERRVGTAKGGWAGAANGLGSMRGMPQWVTRHKFGGSASDYTASTNNPHAVLHNNVPWIDQVLSPAGASEAVRIQREKMERHIDYVVAYQARKAGFHVRESGAAEAPPAA